MEPLIYYQEYVKKVCTGVQSMSEVLHELKLVGFDVITESYDNVIYYIALVKALKSAEKYYLKEEEKRKKNKRLISQDKLFNFLYSTCRNNLVKIDTNYGFTFQFNEDLFLDGQKIVSSKQELFVSFDDNELLSKIITYIKKDGYYYQVEGDLLKYYSTKDDMIFDEIKVSMLKKSHHYEKIMHDFPNMRYNDPDKYYAIMNPNYKGYCRDHYLRDQFIYLLSTIPQSDRSSVVIFGPFGPSMGIYHTMGFKQYLHFVSNEYVEGQKYDLITDLTGFYVLMDPITFRNKNEMDGEEELLNSRYSSLFTIAKGVGFLQYYKMDNFKVGDITFLQGYDSYIYTPHKPCFYVMPEGLSSLPGHQKFFTKVQGIYTIFVRTVNLLRTVAYGCDMTKYEEDYLYNLFDVIKNYNILTDKEFDTSYKVVMHLLQYFNFPMLSYYFQSRKNLGYDDRRQISNDPVATLFSNERSVQTFANLDDYTVVSTRGYIRVIFNKKSTKFNVKDYDIFKKRFIHNNDNRTSYLDKYSVKGPVSPIDKRKYDGRWPKKKVKPRKDGVKIYREKEQFNH